MCVSAVGLLDRSELTKPVLQAPSAQLSHLVSRLTGGTVKVGGALRAGGAWWCRSAADWVVVLCEPSVSGRLRERLRTQERHHVALTVHDHTDDWAAIAVIGRAAPKVLAAVGAYGDSGDPRRVSPGGRWTWSSTRASQTTWRACGR